MNRLPSLIPLIGFANPIAGSGGDAMSVLVRESGRYV